MASGGQSGYGMTLSGFSTGAIGDITSITHPNLEANMIDITTMSATNGWREFVAGLKTAGEITVEVWYTTAQTATVLAAFAGADEVWTISFPDAADDDWVCNGVISGLSGTSPLDDGITQSITITLTGEPTRS